MSDPVLYTVFIAIIVVLLGIDLFVVQRNTHAVSIKEAGIWSAIWIAVSIVFGLAVMTFHHGGVEYFTGYLIEKSLSVDNVFVFVLIFGALSVPRHLQHRVLYYGVLGAIVMRTILILAGATLVHRFSWLLSVFGAFLLYAAWKTWRQRHESTDITDSRLMRAIRRVFPTTQDYHGEHFFAKEDGRLRVTPLFIVLVLIEFSDLIFAVDSIPAIFAITQDPFIVLTSNIFAILGLRSLYFLLAGAADRLRFLKVGLAIILGYVGVKILTENIKGIPHPSPLMSLGIVMVILAGTVVASLVANWREERDARMPVHDREPARLPRSRPGTSRP
jgi:tellurite resistance protein TerC